MFQSLRPSSPIYILHKSDKPVFEEGCVTNVTTPRSKYGVTPTFVSNPQEQVVDITARVNDVVVNYTNLPATLDVADSFIGNDSIVISDNRDAMNSELMNLKKKSEDIINSVDYHKELLSCYEKIIQQINPEIAEKQKQKDELAALRTQVSSLSNNVSELVEANRLLIEQLKQK
jgi:hypothetical protein